MLPQRSLLLILCVFIIASLFMIFEVVLMEDEPLLRTSQVPATPEPINFWAPLPSKPLQEVKTQAPTSPWSSSIITARSTPDNKTNNSCFYTTWATTDHSPRVGDTIDLFIQESNCTHAAEGGNQYEVAVLPQVNGSEMFHATGDQHLC